MRNILTIAKREYGLYFSTPMAYLVAFLYFLVLGLLFHTTLVDAMFQQYTPGIEVVISPMVTLILFVTPAITMRLLAAEQGSGTIELLLTAPVRDWELVTGKWLGGTLFMFTLLGVTWVYPIILNRLVEPGIEQGTLITGYLGLALISASLIAIGVAVSSLFKNQNAAFFATLGIFLFFWLIGVPGQASGGGGNQLLTYLDIRSHFINTFFRGVIDLSDVVYYLSLTTLALFFGSLSIETRRWR